MAPASPKWSLTKIALSRLLEGVLATLREINSQAAKMSTNDQFEPKDMPGAWDPAHQSNDDSFTPYISVQANKISTKHNILAAIFSWLTLAGFFIVLVVDLGQYPVI